MAGKQETNAACVFVSRGVVILPGISWVRLTVVNADVRERSAMRANLTIQCITFLSGSHRALSRQYDLDTVARNLLPSRRRHRRGARSDRRDNVAIRRPRSA